MRHHIDVGLMEVPPDPSMVGSDVKGEFPSTHLHLPSAHPPVLTGLGDLGEHKRALEVWKVEPVRDDSLERHVGLADHNAGGPSIMATSPDAGHRGVAVWPSQHQRDWVARNRLDRSVLDPPDDPGSGVHDNCTAPGASSGPSPPTWPSCSEIGCPGSLKGYTGRSGRTALPGRRLLHAHGAIVGPGTNPALVHTWSTLT